MFQQSPSTPTLPESPAVLVTPVLFALVAVIIAVVVVIRVPRYMKIIGIVVFVAGMVAVTIFFILAPWFNIGLTATILIIAGIALNVYARSSESVSAATE